VAIPYFSTEPDSADMVIEPGLNGTVALLCVACEWEGTAAGSPRPEDPWPIFRQHKCKMKTLSLSSGD
jgi:hypothetical protein